jgi:hypothetical protein
VAKPGPDGVIPKADIHKTEQTADDSVEHPSTRHLPAEQYPGYGERTTLAIISCAMMKKQRSAMVTEKSASALDAAQTVPLWN